MRPVRPQSGRRVRGHRRFRAASTFPVWMPTTSQPGRAWDFPPSLRPWSVPLCLKVVDALQLSPSPLSARLGLGKSSALGAPHPAAGLRCPHGVPTAGDPPLHLPLPPSSCCLTRRSCRLIASRPTWPLPSRRVCDHGLNDLVPAPGRWSSARCTGVLPLPDDPVSSFLPWGRLPLPHPQPHSASPSLPLSLRSRV